MADIRITSLALLTSVDPVNDPLLIEDVSSGETKKTTAEYLKTGMSLGNVDNTSDLDKPISTATQSALNLKQDVITGAATTIVSSNLATSIVLISDASGKVAASSISSTELGYLSGVTSAIQTQLNGKQGSLTLTTTGTSGAATLIGDTLNIPQYSGGGGVAGVSSLEGLTGDLSLVAGTGISITDNGSNTITITNTGGGGGSVAWGDITGTLSSQTDLQSALDGKEPTITAGTTSQYYRGDKTFQTLDKTAVGLSNVDNTSDLNKPVSTATQTALDGKIAKSTGTTYNVFNLSAVTQAEYDAIVTKDADTIYFII